MSLLRRGSLAAGRMAVALARVASGARWAEREGRVEGGGGRGERARVGVGCNSCGHVVRRSRGRAGV